MTPPSHCPIVVSVPSESAEARVAEPVTIGVPVPRGWAADGSLVFKAPDNMPQACGTRILDRWPDGSPRWVLLDFLASCTSDAEAVYRLEPGSGAETPSSDPITVTESADAIRVDTGAMAVTFARQGPDMLRAIQIDGRHPIACDRTGFVVETDAGIRHRPSVVRAEVTHHTPIRVVVRFQASVGSERNPLLLLDIDFEAFSGSASVRCSLTVHNPRVAEHPGGIWELGSAGSVFLRDLSFELVPASEASRTEVWCSPELHQPLETFSTPFTLYQDSSGGKNWRSSNHVNRHGTVPVRFQGYAITSAGGERAGLRATPVVVVVRPDLKVAISTQHFWQNFPKAMEVDGDTLRFRIFPSQFGDVHEIQGGEQKTHVFSVSLASDAASATPLEGTRAPLFVRCTPEWYCATEAVPFLVPTATDPHKNLVNYQRAAIEGPDAFAAKREVTDEYGWRNFGDLYADHEAVSHTGSSPLVSHYNNQYDAAVGMAWQFFRSGDERWWRAFLELSSHVRDIDVYHTTRDKAAYNGGMFWHTYHYLDAGKCSHRSYPKAPGVAGGGPANEHNYSSGLLLRYFLTGDVRFREAVIGLAEWVINMDDGRQHVLGWIATAPTGLASSTGNPSYHGPGRGPAYSIQTLLNAHQLTGEPRYLAKAEELVLRCIHPEDDIAGLNLLDAERRWYYTVFLQALGSYLIYKESRDNLDSPYWYARTSVLRYARWMAEHEYPYLDKPEILEYPTETWAAMDMRKSEVFCHAARYAEPPERERFLERAAFFFGYSVSTLRRAATGNLARPLTILLTNGLGFSHIVANGLGQRGPAKDAQTVFAERVLFEPQRAIARRIVVSGIAISALVGGLLIIYWLS